MIGVVVNGCHSLPPENAQVTDMDDKQSLQSDWLSDMLRNELLISEKELLGDFDKIEYSFLRNLLNDTVSDDKYERYEEIQRGESDVFDTAALSANVDNIVESDEPTEQSDIQEAHVENDTVVKPPQLAEKGSKHSRLHCQISRTNSVTDRSFADDFTDNLLKTPAGFYDRSCSPSCLSIPPLFDYSSSPFSYPCHSDASCSSSFGSTNASMLCSIMEDEKWSEGSEISSVDIDASSSSALSPVDFPEDVMLSMSEDEEKEEERVVLSVVQNVLSDEAVPLSLDDTVKDESCCEDAEEHQNSSEGASSETPVVAESRPLPPSSTPDLSRLNPLAQPFKCVSKMPVQPMPVVITPNMSTVVVPVKFAYTRLVPVATSKSATSKHPEKKVYQNNTPVASVLSPNALNGDVRPWVQCSTGPVMANYYNTRMYYYNPWQPVYYVGCPLVPVSQMSSSTSPLHRVKPKSKKVVIGRDVGRS